MTYFFEYITFSVEFIKEHKMRSFLAVLGIVIGIVSVTIMLSVGFSLKKEVDKMFASQANLITITPQITPKQIRNNEYNNQEQLTEKDVHATKDIVKKRGIVSVNSVKNVDVGIGKENVNLRVIATDQNYFFIHAVGVSAGSFVTDDSMSQDVPSVVIGRRIAKKYFGTINVIGKEIRIENKYFTIVGVVYDKKAEKEKNNFSRMNSEINNAIIIPRLFAMKNLSFGENFNSIIVRVNDKNNRKKISNDILYALVASREISAIDQIDVALNAEATFAAMQKKIAMGLTAFLGLIGGISLVVGGIGVMNIMLVSVTERRREIGIRKAIGATRTDIVVQFLTESVVLALISGVIGIAISFTFLFVINVLVAHFAKEAEISILLSWQALILALLFSVLVGIICGVYPARRAAKLKVIETLRSE